MNGVTREGNNQMKATKKKTSLKEYKTLEDIKKDWLDAATITTEVQQSDVMVAIEHLDMSDSDLEELFEWFAEHGIEVKADDVDEVSD